MSARLRVVVLGAGGEMGSRVCRLVGALHGVEVLGASRRARARDGIATARADVRDATSVARLLRAGDLVVNCAGPFDYDPAPLVAACAATRAHYCDLAEDVAFVERAREAARRVGSRESAGFACSGASTVPGLVGILARAFSGSPRAHEVAAVAAYLSVGSGNPVSAGLLASLLAPLGRPLPGGGSRCFAQLFALRAGDGRTLHFGSYPAAFPRGGVELGARPVPLRFAFGFDRAPLTALLRAASPWLARLPAAALPKLVPALLPLARMAQAFGTPLGLLAVVAEDASGAEVARVELAARARGLDVPASPPVWIAARLARGETLRAGCAELHELVPLADVVSWACARGELSLRASGSLEL